VVLRYTIGAGKSERPARGMTDRQAAGYRNDRPIALKFEVGAACELEVGAARAVPAAVGCVLVALAQPTVSATGTAMAASTIVGRLDTIMPIRRAPARPGSGRHPAVAKVRPGPRCGGCLVLTVRYAS
jgi:hypothetical protein